MASVTAESRIKAYGSALLAVAGAEGNQAAVEQELQDVAQALRDSAELTAALSTTGLDAARRQQLVEDLLGGRALPQTVAGVSMVMAAGRGDELLDVIDAAIDLAAAQRNRSVARVRSAVDLSGDQKARLAAAIKTATGLDVEISVIIDPSVLGGVITEIGDDVIDGSVRRRLHQMRTSIA